MVKLALFGDPQSLTLLHLGGLVSHPPGPHKIHTLGQGLDLLEQSQPKPGYTQSGYKRWADIDAWCRACLPALQMAAHLDLVSFEYNIFHSGNNATASVGVRKQGWEILIIRWGVHCLANVIMANYFLQPPLSIPFLFCLPTSHSFDY